MTERTLFSAEYKSSGGRIVRTHLTTKQSTDVYNQGSNVLDMAILAENLLFVELFSGVKAVPKDASGPVAAQKVITTGLNECNRYFSIHVAEGE